MIRIMTSQFLILVILARICGSQNPAPVRLTVYTVNTSALRLQWSPTADDFNYSSFVVQCNDTFVAETSAYTYWYTQLMPGTSHWCRIDAIAVSSGTTTVLNGTAIEGQTMAAPLIPEAPSDIAHVVSDTTIRIEWSMSTTAYERGVTHYTIHRDGLVAGSIPLVSQPLGAMLSYLLTSLSPATPYGIAVAAHNFYGTSVSSPATVTSLDSDCSSVVCADPPSCNSSYKQPTAVPGVVGCCSVFVCTCVLSACPAPPSGLRVCEPEEHGMSMAPPVADTDGCCPTYICNDTFATTTPRASVSSFAIDTAGPCGGFCAVCNTSGASAPVCTACQAFYFLLHGMCVASCPSEGYLQVGGGSAGGMGQWCQPFSCDFLTREGSYVRYGLHATWCNGMAESCTCVLSGPVCQSRLCELYSATSNTTVSIITSSSTTSIPTSSAVSTTEPEVSRTTPPVRDSTTRTTLLATTTVAVAATTRAPPVLEPIDGRFTSWSLWSTCVGLPPQGSSSGYSQRTRSCSNPYPAHGGLSCVGSTIQTTSCDVTTSSPTLLPTSDVTTSDSATPTEASTENDIAGGLGTLAPTASHTTTVRPTTIVGVGAAQTPADGASQRSNAVVGVAAAVGVVAAVGVALVLRATWQRTHGARQGTATLHEPAPKRAAASTLAGEDDPGAHRVDPAPLAVRNLSFVPDDPPEKMLTTNPPAAAAPAEKVLTVPLSTVRGRVAVYGEAEC
eukprot:m.621938 g.621938  ORF g.621938 m.621938 type:complete len:728 (-) comp22539_c0_seq1:505-2688(-)